MTDKPTPVEALEQIKDIVSENYASNLHSGLHAALDTLDSAPALDTLDSARAIARAALPAAQEQEKLIAELVWCLKQFRQGFADEQLSKYTAMDEIWQNVFRRSHDAITRAEGKPDA